MSRLLPSEAYLHGLDAPAVVVPGRIAAWLERAARLGELRVAHRGRDPEIDAVLVALGTAAALWRQSRAIACDVASEQAKQRADEPRSAMTTSEVAALLGITSSGVRYALADGRLSGRPSSGGWLIDPESVEHFRAVRAARAERRRAS